MVLGLGNGRAWCGFIPKVLSLSQFSVSGYIPDSPLIEPGVRRVRAARGLRSERRGRQADACRAAAAEARVADPPALPQGQRGGVRSGETGHGVRAVRRSGAVRGQHIQVSGRVLRAAAASAEI